MFQALISCIENTFDTWIYRKMQNSYDNHSFIGSYFIRQHIYPCVKCVFNTWYSCAKCTNIWMNELRTIFIFNLSHVKFVMIQQSPKKKGLVLFFWPIFISEKNTTFAKTYGLKKRCYWECVEKHSKNMMGIHWEPNENTLGTRLMGRVEFGLHTFACNWNHT